MAQEIIIETKFSSEWAYPILYFIWFNLYSADHSYFLWRILVGNSHRFFQIILTNSN